MFCPKCGTGLEDNPDFCPKCGARIPPDASTPPAHVVEVGSGLVPALLATLFCCMPVGIVAIVFASQSSTLAAHGDIAGAIAAANKSRKWSWIAFTLGLLGTILYGRLAIAGLAGR